MWGLQSRPDGYLPADGSYPHPRLTAMAKKLRARPFHRPGRFLPVLLLQILGVALLVVAIIFLIKVFAEGGSKIHGMIFIGFLFGAIFVTIIRRVLEAKITCPLCHGTVLRPQRCRKHKNARRFPLFTHRATAVIELLTKMKFTCMYCGTPFRLKR